MVCVYPNQGTACLSQTMGSPSQLESAPHCQASQNQMVVQTLGGKNMITSNLVS